MHSCLRQSIIELSHTCLADGKTMHLILNVVQYVGTEQLSPIPSGRSPYLEHACLEFKNILTQFQWTHLSVGLFYARKHVLFCFLSSCQGSLGGQCGERDVLFYVMQKHKRVSLHEVIQFLFSFFLSQKQNYRKIFIN